MAKNILSRLHKEHPVLFSSFLRKAFLLTIAGATMLNSRILIGLSKIPLPRPDLEISVPVDTTPTAPGLADEQGSLKKVLYYTASYRKTNWFGLGQEAFAECKVKDCFAVENDGTQDIRDFDAVLVHPWNIEYNIMSDSRAKQILHDNPRPRRAKYVFLSKESPQSFSMSGWADDLFDWTWSYRFDSDIQWLPAQFPPLNQANMSSSSIPNHSSSPNYDSMTFDMDKFVKEGLPLMPDEIKAYAKKPKKIAWIVSNCKAESGRNEYAAELSRNVSVDIMGKCGSISCDRAVGHGNLKDNCSEAVMTDYKYYLSFENSLCLDYVTEKFFMAFRRNVIPIVMGGSDYTRIAPPHSFIDVNDFEDAKHLAEYIQKLEENETLYLSYFWWRQYFGSPSHHGLGKNGMCQLCEKLHNVDEEHPPQQPLNITHWWDEKGKCRLP